MFDKYGHLWLFKENNLKYYIYMRYIFSRARLRMFVISSIKNIIFQIFKEKNIKMLLKLLKHY